jgi:hypothetical protein
MQKCKTSTRNRSIRSSFFEKKTQMLKDTSDFALGGDRVRACAQTRPQRSKGGAGSPLAPDPQRATRARGAPKKYLACFPIKK